MSRNDVILAELTNDPEAAGYAALAAAQDYPALAALLNARATLPNATVQALIPKRLSLGDLLAAVSPQEALAVMSLPNLPERTERAADANDRSTLATLVGLLAQAGELSPQSVQALSALMQQTEPDPTWQAEIAGQSRAEALGLGVVSERDVQGALT